MYCEYICIVLGFDILNTHTQDILQNKMNDDDDEHTGISIQ